MPRLESPYRWDIFVFQLRSEHFLGVTQESLARKLNVSVFSVSKWERGEAVPLPKQRNRLKRLASRTGYTEDQWPRFVKPMSVVQVVQ